MKAVSVQEGIIGLEIHVYLVTKEKLFCRCLASRERGLKENVNICPVCTGMPGAKPMPPNKTAVEKAVQIALMLGCSVNERLQWQRKHYDWPDLPKGYQNTLSGRHAIPIGVQGKFFGIRITEMHLEEDPASWDPATGRVDYNRSGLPLVEIVTEPDFTTGEEVAAWLKKLLHHLVYLKAADSNAGIKADVNVNIPGKTERVEIKNMNSIEDIEHAVVYEFQRQQREGTEGRETRRYDASKGKTMKMREKETGEDYRFIAEPDLRVLIIHKEFVEEQKALLPETPEQKLEKLMKKHGIDVKSAELLAKNLELVEFFERVAKSIEPKFALPWVTIELLRVLNWNKKKLDEVDIKAEHFAALLKLVKDKKITKLQAKRILNEFVPKSFMPAAVEGRITDEKELEKVAKAVIAKNEKAAEDYKKGEQQALNFLMGAIMQATRRRADFVVARKVLERVLKK